MKCGFSDFNVFYECADGDRCAPCVRLGEATVLAEVSISESVECWRLGPQSHSTTHADNDVLSATLAQLDLLVGCAPAERRWLPDSRVNWADGFLLSGMTAGGGGGTLEPVTSALAAGAAGRPRRAWRLSPRLPLSLAHGRHHQITPDTKWDPARLVVSAPGAATLALAPLEFGPPAARPNVSAAAPTEWCELQFAGGALLQLDEAEKAWRAMDSSRRKSSSGGRSGGRAMQLSAAPFGLWIVQPADAPMPRMICPGGWTGVWPVASGG